MCCITVVCIDSEVVLSLRGVHGAKNKPEIGGGGTQYNPRALFHGKT